MQKIRTKQIAKLLMVSRQKNGPDWCFISYFCHCKNGYK